MQENVRNTMGCLKLISLSFRCLHHSDLYHSDALNCLMLFFPGQIANFTISEKYTLDLHCSLYPDLHHSVASI